MMHEFLLFLLSILISSPLLSCAPIPDTEPSYASGPGERGTIQLLWSCSMTFVLCIWTAMHPNVVPWPSLWDKIFYKLTWLLFAVYVPEIVVCAAVGQLLEAKDIQSSWQKKFGQKKWQEIFGKDKPKDGSNIKEWLGMPGAFFVVMGGFVIEEERDTTETDASRTNESQVGSQESTTKRHSKRDCSVTTVHPLGFKKLLDEDIIPTLIAEDKLTEALFLRRNIEDKGKAGGVAKLLVTIQILWMGIQCLGRRANGLPLSLLEGHVLIQLPFAIAAFLCWWYKPLDVSEPICLTLRRGLFNKIRAIVEEEKEQFTLVPHFTTERMHHGGIWQMAVRAAYDFTWHLTFKGEVFSVALAIINGGLHAVAWNSHFPTVVEQQLWRISAIGTGLLPAVVLWAAWLTGFHVYCMRLGWHERKIETKWWGLENLWDAFWRVLGETVEKPPVSTPDEQKVREWPDWYPMWARYLLPLIILWSLSGYAACVAYLTVESFVSTRSLPKGGYANVKWADFFPHI